MSRIYDLLARVYDQPEHLEVTAAFHRAILPLVRARPKGTWVLDVACGTGVLAEKLARGRCPVVGVDGSREMLADCAEALPTVGVAGAARNRAAR